MGSVSHRAAVEAAANAILDDLDPMQHLDRIEPEQRELALSKARSYVALACWHADQIAALATSGARREAVDALHSLLQPAVRRRLTALWRSRAGIKAPDALDSSAGQG